MSKNINKYQLRCSSENNLVYTWSETTPSKCPNNTNHLIDLSSIKIIDNVIQNTVTILQSDGATGEHFCVESKQLIIPANSTVHTDYTWPYPISVMTINWECDSSHIGDVINGYVVPNTTIGAITSNITQGDTLINVSSTVFQYIKVGFFVTVTNGYTTINFNEVLVLDKINNTLLLKTPASTSLNAPAYVKMTIRNMRNVILHSGITNLANKHVGSSALPANKVARLEYTNNGNVEKTFNTWIEYLY
jgi:hypothetical protein